MMAHAKLIAAGVLVFSGVILAVVGQPHVHQKIDWQERTMEAELASRRYHIDSAEVVALMHNPLIPSVLLDVRKDADFNLFHLRDARHWPHADQDDPDNWAYNLSPESVKVVMSNDEALAEAAWKHLRAHNVTNIYILAGGINRWLDIYKEGEQAPHSDIAAEGNGNLRHEFSTARGSEYRFARPDPTQTPKREYQEKIVIEGPTAPVSGGCG